MAAKDVILTITLMLGAGLASRLVADVLRLPHMLVLLGADASPPARDGPDSTTPKTTPIAVDTARSGRLGPQAQALEERNEDRRIRGGQHRRDQDARREQTCARADGLIKIEPAADDFGPRPG